MQTKSSKTFWGDLDRMTRKPGVRLAALGGVMAVMLLCLFATVAVLGTGMWLTLSGSSDSARVEDLSGVVEMTAADGSGAWTPLASGDELHSGQRVRTGAGSNARLVFADGSQTVLGAGADLTLNRVDGRRGVLHVMMTQNAGKSEHQVNPERGERSSYLVFTPTGMVSVHGTAFDIAVGAAGQTLRRRPRQGAGGQPLLAGVPDGRADPVRQPAGSARSARLHVYAAGRADLQPGQHLDRGGRALRGHGSHPAGGRRAATARCWWKGTSWKTAPG